MFERLDFGFWTLGQPAGPARECPTCGFDALLIFPLLSVTMDGVSARGTIAACVRCQDVNNRADDR